MSKFIKLGLNDYAKDTRKCRKKGCFLLSIIIDL